MPQWSVGGVSLPHGPYMIGAGVCKTPARTKRWLEAVPVVSGSYTPSARSGNSGRVMWPDTFEGFLEMGFGLNSYGMPNMGIDRAISELSTLKSEQPLIVSIAGFSVANYTVGVEIVAACDAISAIELNFGCPNMQGDHPDIISFDPAVVHEILSLLVADRCAKPIWLKFSPYSNPAELKRMAELINSFVGSLKLAVVTCNTFPNAYAGDEKIDPNDGMAGLSGPYMKPVALGQVRQFRRYLDDSVDVIGVGGITTGDDIIDFLESGAAAVQIVSLAHWAGSAGLFFEHLLNQQTASRFIGYMIEDV